MKMEALQKDKGALQKEIDNLKSQKEEMEMKKILERNCNSSKEDDFMLIDDDIG